MKIFLAGAEAVDRLICRGRKIDYGLTSFMNYSQLNWERVNANFNEILVDSGAFSFLNGKEGFAFEKYVCKYIDFVKVKTSQSNILGFFEMDVGRVLGEDVAMDIRRDLNKVSDKIIPVWHPHQHLEGYYNMLEQYKGRRVSIAQALEKLEFGQYNLFLNTAHKYNCSMHILGFTKVNLFDRLNFGKNDSVDSCTWQKNAAFGKVTVTYKDKRSEIQLPNMPWSREELKINLYSYINLMNIYKEYDNA